MKRKVLSLFMVTCILLTAAAVLPAKISALQNLKALEKQYLSEEMPNQPYPDFTKVASTDFVSEDMGIKFGNSTTQLFSTTAFENAFTKDFLPGGGLKLTKIGTNNDTIPMTGVFNKFEDAPAPSKYWYYSEVSYINVNNTTNKEMFRIWFQNTSILSTIYVTPQYATWLNGSSTGDAYTYAKVYFPAPYDAGDIKRLGILQNLKNGVVYAYYNGELVGSLTEGSNTFPGCITDAKFANKLTNGSIKIGSGWPVNFSITFKGVANYQGFLPEPEPEPEPEPIPDSIVTTFKGDPKTSRAFTWHTKGSDAAGTVVQYMEGFEFDWTLATAVNGTSTQLGESVSHKAEITNLKAGTTYSYRVGGGSEKSNEGWSQPQTFTTEAANSAVLPFSFVHFTDAQGASQADYNRFKNTLLAAVNEVSDIKFFLDGGDLVNNGNSPQMYKWYFQAGEGIFDKIPIMAVPGNHEYDNSSKGIYYESHFNFPSNGTGLSTVNGGTYSFDYGSVHFTGIDANFMTTDALAEKMAAWLARDLAGSDKQWKIVLIHQGPYMGRRWSIDSRVTRSRKYLVPVFDEYGVDLVLQGHDHHYARTYFMKEPLTPLTPPGPVQDTNYTQIKGSATGTFAEPKPEQEGTLYTIANSPGKKFYNDVDTANATYPYMNNLPWFDVFCQPNLGVFVSYTVNGDTICAKAYTVNLDGTINNDQPLDTYALQHSIIPPAEVTNIDYSYDDGTLNISWTDSVTEGAGVLIYDLDDLYRAPAVVQRGEQRAEITGLPSDRSSRYVIKTIAGRNISKGKMLEPMSFEITKIEIYVGEEKVDLMPNSGRVRVKMEYTLKYQYSEETANAIIAVYRKDTGKLEEVKAEILIIDGKTSYDYEETFELSECSDGYYIKCFLWEELSLLRPLAVFASK